MTCLSLEKLRKRCGPTTYAGLKMTSVFFIFLTYFREKKLSKSKSLQITQHPPCPSSHRYVAWQRSKARRSWSPGAKCYRPGLTRQVPTHRKNAPVLLGVHWKKQKTTYLYVSWLWKNMEKQWKTCLLDLELAWYIVPKLSWQWGRFSCENIILLTPLNPIGGRRYPGDINAAKLENHSALI